MKQVHLFSRRKVLIAGIVGLSTFFLFRFKSIFSSSTPLESLVDIKFSALLANMETSQIKTSLLTKRVISSSLSIDFNSLSRQFAQDKIVYVEGMPYFETEIELYVLSNRKDLN